LTPHSHTVGQSETKTQQYNVPVDSVCQLMDGKLFIFAKLHMTWPEYHETSNKAVASRMRHS
jgi:hypothetical protein